MRDPYAVLGVPQGASSEQINAAYKELLRKYQNEGRYDKIDEINQAYDDVIASAQSDPSAKNTQNRYSNADYSDIRSRINAGRLDDAQILLDGIPESRRDAQWYYLKGVVQQKRGWLEEAAKNYSIACSLDPSNNTYKAAFNKINSARSGGYRTNRQNGDTSCSACNICSGLLCADCCCECMGGDCIPCC